MQRGLSKQQSRFRQKRPRNEGVIRQQRPSYRFGSTFPASELSLRRASRLRRWNVFNEHETVRVWGGGRGAVRFDGRSIGRREKDWVVPEWAKGMALAGAVAASLTAATSFASFWLEDPANAAATRFNSAMFWPELGFLLCAMGVIIVAVRKQRLRLMLLLTGILTAAFWIGMTLS
jgi:hypothetical protein